MQDFGGRVAVVTGAASGIGRALAAALSDLDMKLVLADVEASALGEVAEALRAEAAALEADALAIGLCRRHRALLSPSSLPPEHTVTRKHIFLVTGHESVVFTAFTSNQSTMPS